MRKSKPKARKLGCSASLRSSKRRLSNSNNQILASNSANRVSRNLAQIGQVSLFGNNLGLDYSPQG